MHFSSLVNITPSHLRAAEEYKLQQQAERDLRARQDTHCKLAHARQLVQHDRHQIRGEQLG